MKARLDFWKASRNGANAMAALRRFVRDCGLEHGLVELVKLRASQINGPMASTCAARKCVPAGETGQRLSPLNA